MPETHKDDMREESCASCGKPLAPGQDWCLECGSAAPGRLRRRAGAKAALAAVGVTVALAGGAVAVSYAALSKDEVKKGKVVFPVEFQATAPAPEPPKTAAKKPSKTRTKKAPPKAAAPTASSAVTKGSPGPTKTTAPAPKPDKPELIDIPENAGALYDPFGRALFSDGDPHDPAAVYDDDKESSWAVTSNGEGDLQVGYVLDLKRDRSLRYLQLLTDTPGFRAEVYGASADELPPTITDSRWAKLRIRDDVDGTNKEKGKAGDGKEKITLSDGTQKYRFLLIWATTPAPFTPPDPPSRTVRLFDLKLYG